MEKIQEGGWRKMPVSWQKDPAFQEKVRSAPQGHAIAALKLYIALCLKANFHPTDFLAAGCAQLSLTSLSELVDVSRPMVIAGLNLLSSWGVIASEGGRPTVWRIVEYLDAPYWVKLPKRPLYGSKSEERILGLIQLPNRRRDSLHALQLYLYLASIRDKHTFMANLSYEQGKKTLGISRNQFSTAISLLALELVSVRTAIEVKEQTGKNFSSSQYWLRGSRKDPFTPNHHDLATLDLDDLEEYLDDVEYDADFDRLLESEPRRAPKSSQRLPILVRPLPQFDQDD